MGKMKPIVVNWALFQARTEVAKPQVEKFLSDKGCPERLDTWELRVGLHSIVAAELQKRGLDGKNVSQIAVSDALEQLGYKMKTDRIWVGAYPSMCYRDNYYFEKVA